MRFKFTANFLVACLTFAVPGVHKAIGQQVVSPVSVTKIKPQEIVFKCIPYSNNFIITVAQKGERQAALFIWNSTTFGSDSSPQIACNLFAQRLTDSVAQESGNLKNLLLTMGRVNDKTVLCLVNNYQEGCNTLNTLFALNSKDARQYAEQPYKFLETLSNFKIGGCENQFLQVVGNPLNDIERQSYFNLTAWENQFLESDNWIASDTDSCLSGLMQLKKIFD